MRGKVQVTTRPHPSPLVKDKEKNQVHEFTSLWGLIKIIRKGYKQGQGPLHIFFLK
jgi:hypothetical protein